MVGKVYHKAFFISISHEVKKIRNLTMVDKKYDIMILSGGFDPIYKGHVRMFKAGFFAVSG